MKTIIQDQDNQFESNHNDDLNGVPYTQFQKDILYATYFGVFDGF